MNNLKTLTNEEVIEKIRESQKLKYQYGGYSCFDYPNEYNRMTELDEEVFESLKADGHANPQDIISTIEMFIDGYGNHEDVTNFSIISCDDFVAEYVQSGFADNDKAVQIFDSLFYWIESNDRMNYLIMNHFSENMARIGYSMDILILD